MINYSNKSSPQIKYKSPLYKQLTQVQQNATEQLFCLINQLDKKYKCDHLLVAWNKVNGVTKRSIRFFSCIQNIKIKNLNNAFDRLRNHTNSLLIIKKTKRQLMNYPCVLLYRILNIHTINIKRQVTDKLISWKALSNKIYLKIDRMNLILKRFAFRNTLSILNRQKNSYQLKKQKKQNKKGVMLAFCQKQKMWILNFSFQRILFQCFNQLTAQSSQLRIQKRQQKQLYTIKRNQSIVAAKNKMSQLKAQLQQTQTVIHKKKQYGKYESTIIINKQNQQFKKMQKDINQLNAQTQILKLALQKKNGSLKQRNLGTIQIQKVFQLSQYLTSSSQQLFYIKKNLKGKIDPNMLNKFQNSTQLKVCQNIKLQNLLSLYQGRLNQNRGQVYKIADQQNSILNNILSSLVGLQFYRRQNNQQIMGVLSELQETTSNLQLIKRKHPLKNIF